MRNFTFKGLFLTAVFMLLGCLTIQAADDDLITKQITIKLDKAGTLPDKIGSSKKYKITNLKIIGEINGTDLRMIRDMTGSDYNRKTTEGNLSVLDLSEAKIVKGGDYYYFRSYDRKRYYTFNNEIGDYTFDGCLNLTSLTLPYSTTKICSYAFSWCMGLTSLIIPSGVEYIGEEAFGNCSALSSLTIPSNVNEIGYKAFNNCSGLTILTLPSRLTKIADDTFQGCSSLKEIFICIDDLETYLTKGFPFLCGVDCDFKYYLNDKEITSIVVPSSVTSLGERVFYKSRELTTITLPSSLTKIGASAFFGCNSLTSLAIPSGVTEIGAKAFSDCSGLTSLAIPSGVTKIANNTFENCIGLNSLIIPSGVEYIGIEAFAGCSALTSITLPQNLTKIELGTFLGCESLISINIPSRITEIGDYAFAGCTSLTRLILPPDLKSIGECAFSYCNSLMSITLPSSVTSIDEMALEGCLNLKEVCFCIDDLETYLNEGHPYLQADCDFKYYLNGKEITNIIIPSSVSSLGYCAFQNCSNLKSVYVSWLTPIETYNAFSGADFYNSTLYVPQGTKQLYSLANGWKDFGNIVEYDPTGIDKTTTSTDIEEVSRYSVNGQRLVGPTKGLNIVKYSDGSMKKVAVQ